MTKSHRAPGYLKLDMNNSNNQYHNSPVMPSSGSSAVSVIPDSQQTADFSSWHWFEDFDQASSSSETYSILSVTAPADILQSSSQDDILHSPNAHPNLSVTSNDDSMQQAICSTGGSINENAIPLNPDERALVLDPGGIGLGIQFHNDIPDLMIKTADPENSERHVESFQNDALSKRNLPGIQYTPELFENEFPFSQEPGFEQLQPGLLMSNSPYTCNGNDRVVQLQALSAALELSPGRLTETAQANRVLVFHYATGEQHKPPNKQKRRKTTEAQRLHRNLIRTRGGQCDFCKARKRRCDVSHLSSAPLHGIRSTSPDEASY